MADDKPEVRVIRQEKYDPNFEDYQKVEFPTNTIKRAKRVTGVSPGTLITSYSTGPGSYIKVTRISFNADREAEFYVKDRSGTVDVIYLEAAGNYTLLGGQDAPIYVLKGSAQFRNIGTQLSAGTYSIALEGIVPQFGSETVS